MLQSLVEVVRDMLQLAQLYRRDSKLSSSKEGPKWEDYAYYAAVCQARH